MQLRNVGTRVELRLRQMDRMGLLRFLPPQAADRDAGGAWPTSWTSNAAFLMQKGIYEYSRARAGHYAKVLFREPEFQAAVELSRWRAYPLGLAMVAEVVEGVLRPSGRRRTAADLRGAECARARGFRPLSGARRARQRRWRELRAELARRLQLIGLHPPKRVMDIPEQLGAEPIST